MECYELPFAKITLVEEDIAEIIVNEGVEMTLDMVEQYHEFLLTHLKPPFSLLINKVNSYTYDFQAQMKIGDLEELNAMSIVVYNRIARITTESLASYSRADRWNMQLFANREQALNWVRDEQQRARFKRIDSV